MAAKNKPEASATINVAEYMKLEMNMSWGTALMVPLDLVGPLMTILAKLRTAESSYVEGAYIHRVDGSPAAQLAMLSHTDNVLLDGTVVSEQEFKEYKEMYQSTAKLMGDNKTAGTLLTYEQFQANKGN